MALVHNQILRALNAAHNHCLTVELGTQAAQDFLIVNQCIVDVLESHHDMEEERLFPALEKILNQPGAMEGNRQEHQAFHDELLEFHSYVFTTDSQGYHGATIKAKTEALGPLVEEHLHNEVPLLYDLHVIDSEALTSLWKDAMNGYKPKFNLFRRFPFMVTCTDNTFL
ncbi:hypothetical protein ETB97_007093 [Aspergillus alliaceus]|uniref:Hemerythrin-like domain-containing protein n=1 Tax=Petromyces alliaceus TaxID=209559 RepID=A0A8H6E371_PETAA|nr:hypothetical protein ETB97_007093 [Aspergillus burnettii]